MAVQVLIVVAFDGFPRLSTWSGSVNQSNKTARGVPHCRALPAGLVCKNSRIMQCPVLVYESSGVTEECLSA
ncbi:unnamed protein product [Calypogeia fissa]